MTFQIFDLVADAFYTLFGGGTMVALLAIGILIFMLLAVRAGKVVVAMVIIPLILTVAAFGVSKFIEIPRWVGVTTFLVLGLLMAFFFWAIMK